MCAARLPVVKIPGGLPLPADPIAAAGVCAEPQGPFL